MKTREPHQTNSSLPVAKPFINHPLRNSFRLAFDFFILLLLLRGVEIAKRHSTVCHHPWKMCFSIALLYFKLRDNLNPFRDGVLQHFLFPPPPAKPKRGSVRSINLFSASPIIEAKSHLSELETLSLDGKTALKK